MNFFKKRLVKIKNNFYNFNARLKQFKIKNLYSAYKEFNVFLGKNLSLIFSSVFKNVRTYVYVFIIPLIFEVIIYIFQTYGGLNDPLPPITAGYLLVPGFAITILFNTLISEWKASIFLKRIHTIGTNRTQFLLAIWLVGYCLGILSIISCGIVITLISPLVGGKNNIFMQLFSFLSYGSAAEVMSSWIGFFVGASIVILASIGIATLISGAFKNIALCQSLGILVIIIAFVLSDLFLSPNVLAGSKIVVFISYFIPQKYGVWTVFYAASSGNLNYILPNPSANNFTVSFFSITWPIIGGIIWCVCLFLLSLMTFKWNNRG